MMRILMIAITIFMMVSCSESKKSESATSSDLKTQNVDIKKRPNTKKDTMVNRLQFTIDIKAEREEIWNALWDDTNYRDWSGIFGKGSHYVASDLKEGSKIMFLAADQSGIYSNIEKHVPNKIIQFKHIGTVVKGQEQPMDEETKKWSGALETYSLQSGTGFYTLLVEIDILDEHVEFMSEKLPIALEKIKENSGK